MKPYPTKVMEPVTERRPGVPPVVSSENFRRKVMCVSCGNITSSPKLDAVFCRQLNQITRKMFNGKALYNPSGKAGEYGQWAVNFYNGCSNGCSYCYLRRGVLSSVMGGGSPTLKKCFVRNGDPHPEAHAYHLAAAEIMKNRDEIIRDGGVFFSFSTDPCLPETVSLTALTAAFCLSNGIPVIILTKCTAWLDSGNSSVGTFFNTANNNKRNVAVGFTLTGHDEMEPGAASNAERMAAMKRLHDLGYRTFASIEPVVDFAASLRMIRECVQHCDHFKIGLLSGAPKDRYSLNDTVSFVNGVRGVVMGTEKTVYWKQSVRDVWGGGSPVGYNFVEADFNIFHDAKHKYQE